MWGSYGQEFSVLFFDSLCSRFLILHFLPVIGLPGVRYIGRAVRFLVQEPIDNLLKTGQEKTGTCPVFILTSLK